MAHVHAEAMRLYAEDAAKHDNPCELWEYSVSGGESWISFNSDSNPLWSIDCLYRRRKQETIDINGHKVRRPLMEDEVKDNTVYYVPALITDYKDEYYLRISDRHYDMKLYSKNGLVHKTKEAAIAHAKALLSFTEQKND